MQENYLQENVYNSDNFDLFHLGAKRLPTFQEVELFI